MASPTPPPSPPPQNRGDSSPDYYYLVLTVAVIAVMLVISNVIAFACCSSCRFVQTLGRYFFFFRSRGGVVGGCGRGQQLIPVCQYRKDQAFDTECSVCLTGFVDGEEVRQLPGCKHSFHAPCIDMWLYSHSSCPLCRASVARMPPQLPRCPRAAAAGEDSRQHRPVALESGDVARVVGVPAVWV